MWRNETLEKREKISELIDLLEKYFSESNELFEFELKKILKELDLDERTKLRKALLFLENSGKITRVPASLPIGDKGLILTEKISKRPTKAVEIFKKGIIAQQV